MSLSLSCFLTTLPAPQEEGSLCPVIHHLLWNLARPARENKIQDFLIQGREKIRTWNLSPSIKPISQQLPQHPFKMLETNLDSFSQGSSSNAKKKNPSMKTQKKDACLSLWGSHSAFLPPHPFYLQMCAGQPAQLQIPRGHVFFKCRSLKGITANGSVALRAFNYVNEAHSKRCMLDFFCLLLSTTPLQFVFFPF